MQPYAPLEGIVTLVDAELARTLDGDMSALARRQVVAADVAILNKIDLVEGDQLVTEDYDMKRLTCVLAAAAVMFAAPAFAQQSAPKPPTLFTNVHVFDGANEKRITNANVLVAGNMIKQVSTAKIDVDDAD